MSKSTGAKRRPAGPGKHRTTKVSLTVDEGVLREVKKDAHRLGRTLSAQVTEALASDVRRRRLQELIEEYEAAHGRITDAELAEARAAWPV